MIDVASVATDADLVSELGSADALANIATATDSSLKARQLALDDVLDNLRNRTPPILDSDLQDLTELSRVVTFGALANLYRSNITTGDQQDVSANKHRIYKEMYESRLRALRPTVIVASRGGPESISFSRR